MKEGCPAFKDLLIELNAQKYDPFTYTTLALVTSAVNKATYLNSKTTATVSLNDNTSIKNVSSVRLVWLNLTRLKNRGNLKKHNLC